MARLRLRFRPQDAEQQSRKREAEEAVGNRSRIDHTVEREAIHQSLYRDCDLAGWHRQLEPELVRPPSDAVGDHAVYGAAALDELPAQVVVAGAVGEELVEQQRPVGLVADEALELPLGLLADRLTACTGLHHGADLPHPLRDLDVD